MHVESVRITNVMGIREAKLELAGKHLILIGGENNQGKTSLIMALVAAICGKRMCDFPDVMLRDGEDEGEITLKLSPDERAGLPDATYVTIRMTRRPDRSVNYALVVVDSTGERLGAAQTTLQSWITARSMDPLSFQEQMKKDPANARRTLLEIVGLSEQYDEIQKTYEADYAERRKINQGISTLKASLAAMPHHDDAPDSELSVSDLMTERQRRVSINDSIIEKKQELARAEALRDDIESQLQDTLNTIRTLNSRAENLKDRLEKGHAFVKELTAETLSLAEQDVGEIDQQLQSVDEHNRKYRDNQAHAATQKRLAEETAKSDELTKRLKSHIADQTSMLKNADWPVEGLSIAGDSITYKGLPFAQAPASVQREVAIVSTLAANPTLRLLASQGGGEHDLKSLEHLEQLCIKHDCQFLLELVTRSDTDRQMCQILVTEGIATQQETAHAAV